MPFITELYVKQVDRKCWQLTADLIYEGEDGLELTVPKGTGTDFASVPQAFWWLVPRSGRHTKAAVLHDWQCNQDKYSRWEADETFLQTLRELEVPLALRRMMWAGVRFGSIRKWRGNLLNVSECGPAQLMRSIGIALLSTPILILTLPVMFVLTLLWLATANRRFPSNRQAEAISNSCSERVRALSN